MELYRIYETNISHECQRVYRQNNRHLNRSVILIDNLSNDVEKEIK